MIARLEGKVDDILFVLLWVIIQVSHFLFPERPQIVFFLETASQLGFLLLFVIWTVVSVVSYAIAERKKVYVTEVQEISRR